MVPPFLTSSGVVYKYDTSTGVYEVTTETPAPIVTIDESGAITIITSTGLELTSGQLPDQPDPTPPDLPAGIIVDIDSSAPFFPKVTVSMTGVDIGLPISFTFPGVDFNQILGFPGSPEIPISIGTGPFDFGLQITFKCPGFPTCGAKTQCTYTKKTPGWQVDPSKWFPFKIPGIPAMPKLPNIPAFNISVPPKWMLPQGCPNYVRSQQNEVGG